MKLPNLKPARREQISTIALLLLYFLEGVILVFPDYAQRIYMNEELGLSPSQIQLIYAAMLLPYLIKPIFAIISDTNPIFGLRRKPYICFNYFACFLSWICLAIVAKLKGSEDDDDEQNNYFRIISSEVAFVCSSLTVCFASVITDSFVVERVHSHEIQHDRDDNNNNNNNDNNDNNDDDDDDGKNDDSQINDALRIVNESIHLLRNKNRDDNNDDNNDDDDDNNDGDVDRNCNVNERCEEEEMMMMIGGDDDNERKEEEKKKKEEEDEQKIEGEKRKQRVGRIQSYTLMSRIMGTLVSSYFSGYMLTFTSASQMFYLQSFFPLFSFIFTFLLSESIYSPPSLPSPSTSSSSSLLLLEDDHQLESSSPLSNLIPHSTSTSPSSLSSPINIVTANDDVENETDLSMMAMITTGGDDNNNDNNKMNINNDDDDNRRSYFHFVDLKIKRWIARNDSTWQGRFIRSFYAIIISLFGDQQLWKPGLFILIISSTPSSYSAFFFFLENGVHLSDSNFGLLSVCTNIASLFGAAIYRFVFVPTNFSIRVIFMISIIISFIVKLSPLILVFGINSMLSIPDVFFAISDSAVITVVSQIALMPLVILGASVSPPGIEGSIYAILMSFTSFGGIIGDLLGTFFTSFYHVSDTNFENLWLLLLTCNLFSLIALFFIPLIPKTINRHDQNQKLGQPVH